MITHGCMMLLVLALPTAPPPAAASGASKATTSAKKPAAKPVDALVQKVQAYYARMSDYSADFVQTYTKVALSQKRELRGVLQLRKPAQARWLYRDPPKEWVINGKRMTMLDPELEQAFVDDNFESAEISRSISFLWGDGRLDESFAATLGDRNTYGFEDGRSALELVPRTGATYRKLVLGVNPKTGEVTDSILFETAGNTNRFQFRNVKLNTGLAPLLFEARTPPGWEIIKQ
ncbi:MAG: outer membrane lipoprotein carrier protein LolA [Myxococcota bacterium]